MKIAVPSGKSVLAPLGITAADLTIHDGTHKKKYMVLEIRL